MKGIGFLFVISISATSLANATLLGDTVHIAQNWPVLGEEYDAVNVMVGSGIDHAWPYDIITFDISDHAIDLTFGEIGFGGDEESPIEFNGPVISNLNDSSGYPLIGLANFTTNSDASFSRLVWGQDFVGFNFSGLSFSSGEWLHIDLSFGPSQSVPEPPAVLLLAAAMLGIGGWRLRYRTK
jgi:hypothetical protein